MGYFPSKVTHESVVRLKKAVYFPTQPLLFPLPFQYVARLQAGEKPLQVLQNLQISDGDKNGSMTLLRDQIVVQVGVSCVNSMRSIEIIQLTCFSFFFCHGVVW